MTSRGTRHQETPSLRFLGNRDGASEGFFCFYVITLWFERNEPYVQRGLDQSEGRMRELTFIKVVCTVISIGLTGQRIL